MLLLIHHNGPVDRRPGRSRILDSDVPSPNRIVSRFTHDRDSKTSVSRALLYTAIQQPLLSPPPSLGVASQLCHPIESRSNSAFGRAGIWNPVPRCVATQDKTATSQFAALAHYATVALVFSEVNTIGMTSGQKIITNEATWKSCHFVTRSFKLISKMLTTAVFPPEGSKRARISGEK